ncbi:flavonol 3-O-glucosyltransferase UGT89B1-like [Lotus japonicus]|uniref:flavonol 3-O-glucosyltransferase UGT89B1-like n=1 Tax=Lotus japonicus TaxID=34305 RepID=UPI002585FBB0|nr:flavonol 3-O-glucosyltransferase UGT89B1-like [Lotus japonicus]
MPESSPQTHLLAYPFPSSGHIIPLIDLTNTLISRGINVTVLLTPSNQTLLPTNHSPLLQTLILPEPHFPNPNQKRLYTITTFMRQHHYPIILNWAHTASPPPTAIISDFFLAWTHHLAADLHILRLIFSPSGAYSLCISLSLWRDLPQNDNAEDQNHVVSFSNLPNSPVQPWWQISTLFRDKRGEPEWETHRENMNLNLEAWGVVFNSFVELEQGYIDHVKKELGHERVWVVGPLLLASDTTESEAQVCGGSSTVPCGDLTGWLDSRVDGSVVYVYFGSRTFLTTSQMEVLTRALELSGVHFVLSVREQGTVPCGFADRVREWERGLVIEGWAPQVLVLSHRVVGAFLTHCGWNSVLEGLASGVVMLTWPMGADQFTNAKLLVDEMGVAVRAAEGTVEVPDAKEFAKRIAGALGRTEVRVRTKELREVVVGAIKKGGSSYNQLDGFVKELNELKNE